MDGIGVIPVFIAVVESGGFTSAANRLGISKSAVSKRIGELEARLGVQLLHRSTRNVGLTEAGERYYEFALDAFEAARKAEDAVAELQQEPIGRLSITVPMSFGRLHIAPLIPEFLKRYPGIKIDMVMSDKFVDLVEGGFDVGIRGGTLPDSSLIARKLAPCLNYLWAAPEYIEEHGKPSEPEDLLEHNCLHYSYFGDAREWTFLGRDEPFAIKTMGNFQVNNGEALHQAIIGGCGIGRLPTFITGKGFKSGRLVRILEHYKMPSQTFYAIFPDRRYLPAKVRVFVDFAIEQFGADKPYWDE